MTRMTGSVPDLRISTRPVPSSRASPSAMAAFTDASSSGAPAPKRTFFSTWARGSNSATASETELVSFSADGRQHLQRGEGCRRRSSRSRSGRGAPILATDIVAMVSHVLDDVAVADLACARAEAETCPDKAPGPGSTSPSRPRRRQPAPLVALPAGDGAIIWSPSTSLPLSSATDQHAVGVAIQRDADDRRHARRPCGSIVAGVRSRNPC